MKLAEKNAQDFMSTGDAINLRCNKKVSTEIYKSQVHHNNNKHVEITDILMQR